MTRPWEKADVQVCTDCVLTLANGLPEDLDPGRAAAITDGITSWAADRWQLEVGDSEGHFSWARCEVCGDGRGGDRHQAWAIRPPARTEHPMNPLIHDQAAWWLADGDALMVAPLDPATGTPAWAQAHPADPMAHPQPDTVLAIQDTLIARTHPPAPVALDQVVNTTTLRPGYLVRDPGGCDLARYDRIDLAQQAAALAGGGIYALGQIGHGPVGWHQIDLTLPTTRYTAGTPTPAAAPAPPAARRGATQGAHR